VNKLAYQMVKYRQREGWTHLDVLRSIHPKVDGDRNDLFGWVAGKTSEAGLIIPDVPIVQSYLVAQAADKLSLPKATKQWTRLVQGSNGLPWEALPDRALKQKDVWAALLDKGMPQGALIRQLPRLTNLGLLDRMGGGYTEVVTGQLTNGERLAKARIHPVSLLLSMKTYASGASLNGKSTWSPVSKVTDALDAAYYASYPHVTPAGKRTLLALDISGSMGFTAGGLPISCREVTAAMSLVTMATEPAAAAYGFGHQFIPLDLSPRQRLDDAVRKISGLPFGSTDCSLPMFWAADNKVEVDTFVVYTDNETWAGRRGHPHEALEHYRRWSGIPARLAVVAITPTPFSIADPSDPGSMDVSGFDSAVPAMLADFSRGDL
jgi:60 kDa SS-A/Ro ribonucleoprotein